MVFKPTIEDVPADRVEAIKIGRVEANGKAYVMIAIKIRGKFGGGSLGHVTDGWLVVSTLYRRAYMFQPKGDLDPMYVAEKLGSLVYRHRKTEIRNMTRLLSQLIGRPAPKHGIMLEEE